MRAVRGTAPHAPQAGLKILNTFTLEEPPLPITRRGAIIVAALRATDLVGHGGLVRVFAVGVLPLLGFPPLLLVGSFGLGRRVEPPRGGLDQVGEGREVVLVRAHAVEGLFARGGEGAALN